MRTISLRHQAQNTVTQNDLAHVRTHQTERRHAGVTGATRLGAVNFSTLEDPFGADRVADCRSAIDALTSLTEDARAAKR